MSFSKAEATTMSTDMPFADNETMMPLILGLVVIAFILIAIVSNDADASAFEIQTAMSFSKEGSSTDDFMTLVSNMISEASTSPEEANELKEWLMSQDEVVDALRRVDSDDVRASLISGLIAAFGRSNKKDSASINDEAADGEEANTEDHGDEEENIAVDASSSRASDSPKESENASAITTENNLCHVLESKEPDDVILPLINATSAKEKDDGGCLPLHYAIGFNASEAVVIALLEAHPEAAKEKDCDGDLPLHLAARYEASEAVVIALLEVHPDAAKEKTNAGFLPLHIAAQFKASEAVVKALLEVHPEAAKEKDAHGRLPLHLAVQCKASTAVIKALLEVHPDAAKEKDDHGRLPLHYAARYEASAAVVKALLELHPEAAKEKDPNDRRPLELLLKQDDVSEELIIEMLKVDMPINLTDGSLIENGRSWTTCIASNRKSAVDAIRYILDPTGGGYCTYINTLLEVRDESDRSAKNLMAPDQEKEIRKYIFFCGQFEIQTGPPEHRSSTSVVLRAKDRNGKVDYKAIFDDADKDKNGMLTEDELPKVAKRIGLNVELIRHKGDSINYAAFARVCEQQLGDGYPQVVIKLMQEEEQWLREKDVRSEFKLDPEYVVGVVELKNAPSDDTIRHEVEQLSGGLNAVQKYLPSGIRLGTRAIILDAADRNLFQIYHQERPDINTTRAYLKQIFLAVEHMHTHNLMHGDLKLLNVVRFQRDNRLRIIDLDACVPIIGDGDDGESYAGAKFSSASLPPEMISRLKDCKGNCEKRDELKNYWQGKGKETWEKVEPKLRKKRQDSAWYAVKSFRMEDNEPVHSGLPYNLVEASKNIDVWALGVMAFILLTGQPLVASTRDDDCATGAAMYAIENWGKDESSHWKDRLKEIKENDAREFVKKMLKRNPADRATLASLLEYDHFLDPKDNDSEVKEVVKEIRDKIEDVNENVIKNREIMENEFRLVRKSLKRVHERQQAANTMLKDIIKGMFIPQCFVILPTEKTEGVKHFFKKLASPRGWVNNTFLLVFYCPILRRAVNGPDGKEIGYEIELPKDWVKKYGPAIVCGLKILEASLVVGRLCGLPIPTLGGALNDAETKLVEASNFVENMQKVLLEEVGNEGDKSVAGALVSKFDATTEEVLGELESNNNPLSDIQKKEIQNSFDEIGALIGDEEFKHCGLKQVTANDGTTEFVHPDIASYFEEHGQDCFDRVDEMEDVASRQRAMNQDQAAGSGRRETLVRTDAVRSLE